ncbi:MAG TPA: TonB family protein [Rhizomicrobium sp.]|nr:TonB family protein [Rhizomicrobium sp.]
MTVRLVAAAFLLVAIASPAMAADPVVPKCMALETKPVALTSHVPTGEDYPPLSIAMNESGDSLVSYVVQPDGSTADLKITHTSGSLRLDDAALAFVGKFKFKPGLSGGKPAACYNEISLRWVVGGASPVAAMDAMAFNAIYPGEDDFPPGAFARKEEGLVVVGIATSPSGSIVRSVVVKPSEFTDLNDATLEFLKNSKVVPARINGKTATSFIVVPVMWTTVGKPPPPTSLPDGDQAQTSDESGRRAH